MKKDNYTEIQELYNAAENSEEAMNSNEAGNSEEAMNSNEAANSSLKEENMTDGKRVEGMYDQKEADELPLIRISVRSLVEFILRSGDIDTRKGGGFDVEAMLAGGRIHRKIQKGKAGDYQAELSLFDEIDCGGYTLRIEGRADGVFTDDGDKGQSKRKAPVKSGKKSGRKKKADTGLTEIELLIQEATHRSIKNPGVDESALQGEEAAHKAIINPGLDESVLRGEEAAYKTIIDSGLDGSALQGEDVLHITRTDLEMKESLLPSEKTGGNDNRADSMPPGMCDDTKILPEDKAVNSLPLVIVDEIKGIYMDPDELDEPIEVHLAQAKFYGAILLRKYLGDGWNDTPCRTDRIGVRMTYVNLEDDKKMRYFTSTYSREEILTWYDSVCLAYRKWTDWQVKWQESRNASMGPLSFPFEYRKGQKNLVSSVYHTIREEKELFLMAPTGVGKTMSVVYPSVRAVGQGMAEKIFYLTAKNQTLTVGAEAFQTLMENGLRLKTIQLTSKEKICPLNEPSCNPDDCPYARGHFDRINDAVFEYLENVDFFDRDSIRAQAEKWKVCPFELGLDTSSWCDAILCDYNYAFDPNAHLRRFFGEGARGKYIFLVDEAHNLVDRAREMYSADLIKEEVLAAKNAVKGKRPKTARQLEKLNKQLLIMRKSLEVLEEEQPGKLNVYEEIERLEETFVNEMLGSYGELQVYFKEERDSGGAEEQEALRDFYFHLRDFVSTYEAMDDDYVIYSFRDEDKHFHLKLFCVNPARRLQEMVDKGTCAIFFSATLLPVNYYKQLLCRRDDTYAVYAETPFRDDQKIILVGTDVSTRYRSRNRNMYQRIAHYIHETVTARRGNYMAFFPSYKFMKDVLDVYRAEYDEDDVNYVAQSRYMSEIDREIFLENFYEDPSMTMVGFCVMGGIFAEGIDLVGSRLIGAIVVGCGLPQVSAETEILRRYYDEDHEDADGKGREKNGFSYAYLIPGMNKVLQSAGRVIRTASDRGVIVLLDDRFLTRECQSMFPREWSSYVPCRAEQVRGVLDEFWSGGEAEE